MSIHRAICGWVLLCLACESSTPASSTSHELASTDSKEQSSLLVDRATSQRFTEWIETERTAWPLEDIHITSAFGFRVDPVQGLSTRLHKGLDLRGQSEDVVLSIAAGRVVFAGQDPLLGNLVIIDHGQNITSYSGHMSSILVVEGLPVVRGTAIGFVGNTGRSQAPHLHLTIKVGEFAIDPLLVLGQPLHHFPALANLPASDS